MVTTSPDRFGDEYKTFVQSFQITGVEVVNDKCGGEIHTTKIGEPVESKDPDAAMTKIKAIVDSGVLANSPESSQSDHLTER